MPTNVFVNPNEQNEDRFNSAMARTDEAANAKMKLTPILQRRDRGRQSQNEG